MILIFADVWSEAGDNLQPIVERRPKIARVEKTGIGDEAKNVKGFATWAHMLQLTFDPPTFWHPKHPEIITNSLTRLIGAVKGKAATRAES